MRQSYSLKRIAASYTPEKRNADGPWTRYVLRPPSYVFAKMFLSLGCSPNTVSLISSLLSILAMFFFVFGDQWLVYTGFFLFFLFGVLDCADGNMARTLKEENPGSHNSRQGEWVDAVSGYVAYAAFFLGIGALTREWFPMLVSGAALAGNLLMRLAFQNYRSSVPEGKARSETGGERKFSESIGITGILVPLSAAAYFFKLLWVVIGLYTVIYCGGFFFIILKITRNFKEK